MPRYTYTVEINGSAYSNVQSLQVQTGRASVQDPFRTGTAVINGRDLTGFVTPQIGWQVVISGTGGGTSFTVYDGRVADVTVQYGIVANQDTWEIRCEDALAEAGRTVITDSWASGTTTYEAANQIGGSPYPDVQTIVAKPGSSQCSGQSVTDTNMLSVLQTLVQTEQGRLFGLGLSTIGWIGRADMANRQVIASFSDGSLTAGYSIAKFDSVTFASLADNYATKVLVQPVGFAAQTSGTGYRTYSMDSYDVSTAQAANLAGYVKNTLVVSSQVPSSLSCIAEQQTNNAALGGVLFPNPSYGVEIILRGVRYACIIEGSVLTVTPESSRFTYYLSSSESYQFLILDNAVYGKLDTGKLGF